MPRSSRGRTPGVRSPRPSSGVPRNSGRHPLYYSSDSPRSYRGDGARLDPATTRIRGQARMRPRISAPRPRLASRPFLSGSLVTDQLSEWLLLRASTILAARGGICAGHQRTRQLSEPASRVALHPHRYQYTACPSDSMLSSRSLGSNANSVAHGSVSLVNDVAMASAPAEMRICRQSLTRSKRSRATL